MKKTILNLLALTTVTLMISSCGTVMSSFSSKRPVMLMQAPNDIKVKVNGEVVDVTKEYLSSNESSGSGVKISTNYFTRGVRLPYKQDVQMELSSVSQNKTAQFTLKSKGSSLFFWGNLFLLPIVGHIIDGTTKNNRLLSPRYIDVEYALQGKPISEWRGKNKLTRKEKKSINNK